MFLHLSKIITRKGGKEICPIIACDTLRKESMLPRKPVIELLVTQDSNEKSDSGRKGGQRKCEDGGKGAKRELGSGEEAPRIAAATSECAFCGECL